MPYVHEVNTGDTSLTEREKTRPSFSSVGDEITTFRSRKVAYTSAAQSGDWAEHVPRARRAWLRDADHADSNQSCNWSTHELSAHHTLYQWPSMDQNPEILKISAKSGQDTRPLFQSENLLTFSTCNLMLLTETPGAKVRAPLGQTWRKPRIESIIGHSS